MKKLFFILFIGSIIGLYFAPIKEDSALYSAKSSIVSIKESLEGPTSQEIKEKIEDRKDVIRQYENIIAQIDADEERMKNTDRVCRITGEKLTGTITKDPRPDLRERIERLEGEIEELESKI